MYQGAIAPRRMTKLEFAQYQNSKGFKVGDFVIRPTASPPFTGLDVLRIIYVEEMHHQIGDHEWSHKGEPMCYHIQNVNGASQNTYWKSTLDFVRKEPLTYEELPFEWRVLVDKERVADRAAEEFAGDCA